MERDNEGERVFEVDTFQLYFIERRKRDTLAWQFTGLTGKRKENIAGGAKAVYFSIIFIFLLPANNYSVTKIMKIEFET